MTDPDRIAGIAMAVGQLLEQRDISNHDAFAVLATVFSVRLRGEHPDLVEAACCWFAEAVLTAHHGYAAVAEEDHDVAGHA